MDTSSSLVSTSSTSIDEEDNDLTDNKVPQTQTQVQTPTQTVQQQTLTQIISPPSTVNVQKIKVRPRPQTVRIYNQFKCEYSMILCV